LISLVVLAHIFIIEMCDDWLTFIHMDAHTFALVLVTILLEPLPM
jgi:hypothetical protein